MIPVYEIESEVRGTVYRLVAALCAGLLMLSVMTLLGLQRFVIRPLRKLDEGTDLISLTGKLDYRIDIETGEEFWISGPRKDGRDRLYTESSQPVEIDEDIEEVYWRDIRGVKPPE